MADVAKGTTLSYGNQAGTSATFTAIGSILSLSGPAIEHPALDVTTLDDATRQFIAAGVADIGELALEVNFDPDTTGVHDQLVDWAIAGTETPFKITWSNGTDYFFQGHITACEPNANVGEQVKGSMTIKATAGMTITA